MKKNTLSIGMMYAGLLAGISMAADSPNFLFIISDDQSYRAIGSSGNPVIQTPHLDALASDGMRFTHCHNMGSYSGAICVASRAMLNAGRYVWHAESAVGTDMLWAEHFEAAGYDTFMSGKWHVSGGGLGETDSAAKAFMSSKALAEGFYESPTQYGRPAANPEWRPDDITLQGHWSPTVWDITNHVVTASYTVQQHTSELYADEAVDYIEALDEESDPFFMYISFNAPHDPRQAPTAYQDLYDAFAPSIPPNLWGRYPYELAGQRDDGVTSYPITEAVYALHLKEYYAMISHMDTQIGRILDALEASGKADNTYVIFTSDHGLAVGQHGYIGKQILYDHSTRVPFIMTGPDIDAGSEEEAMFYIPSIVPTTLELAGIPVPPSIDFPSLTGLINGSTNKLYDSLYGGLFADGQPQRMIRTEKYKLILYPYLDVYLLYDLEEDPWETNNLLEQTTYGRIANNLYDQYLWWHAELEDPYVMPFIDFSTVHVDDAETGKIIYTGSWNHISRNVSIEDTISLNYEAGAAAELTFEGVDVRLYTQMGAGAGIFDIYLDGEWVETFDCYSPSQRDGVKAFERTNLTPGVHTLRMVNAGTKNPSGSGYNVHLDMITYNRTGVRPTGLSDRTDEPGSIITSAHTDSPVGQGHEALFDNDVATRYTTSNQTSWVRHQFTNGNQYAVKWYSLTSAQKEPGPTPVNLVLNGSFESEPIAPWTQGNVVAPPVTHDGPHALRMVAGSGQTVQQVTVQTGVSYRLSVWIDSSGWSSGKVVFDTQDLYDSTCQFVLSASNGGWQEYTGTFTATRPDLTLRIFASPSGYAGTVYFDNISVTELQPPVGTSEKDPSGWSLSGSNDGNQWEVLDERAGVIFTRREQPLEFDVLENKKAYEYYQFNLTNGSGQELKFSEVELFGFADELDDPWNPWPAQTYLPAADDDGDGYNNLQEYALGGNPEAPDAGLEPVFVRAGQAFQFIHKARTDDPSLTYRVESTTNLVSGTWATGGSEVAGMNVRGAYAEVTNTIPTLSPSAYYRLMIDAEPSRLADGE